MRIPNDVGLWLQKTLLGYDGERWSMADFVLGNLGSIPVYTVARWQFGVDMVYRAITCDLVWTDRFGFPDLSSFFRAIRTLSPDDKSGASIWNGKSHVEGGFLWNGSTIYGTKRLGRLVEACFPPPGERDDKLNPAFIEALEETFAQHNVAWTDKPLLPVLPDGPAALH